MNRHIVTNLKTKEKHKFIGGEEARNKAYTLFWELYGSGIAVEWLSEPIEEYNAKRKAISK